MAKRKYGEGSIRQRKDGRWEGRIVIAYQHVHAGKYAVFDAAQQNKK